jgi:hypothetical protein
MKKEELLKLLDENIQYLPDILTHTSIMLSKYKEYCKGRNDTLLREALGDAVHLLGMDKKLPKLDMKRHCARIIEAIYPRGITKFHHQGEVEFWNKYIK